MIILLIKLHSAYLLHKFTDIIIWYTNSFIKYNFFFYQICDI